MTKKLFICALILLFAFTLSGCGKKQAVVTTYGNHADHLQIEDATSLVLVAAQTKTSSRSGSTLSTEGETKLYKITEGGELVEVPILDEQGNEVPTTKPLRMYDATPEYVIIVLDEYFKKVVEYNGGTSSSIYNEINSYLVRKTDGATWLLGGQDKFPRGFEPGISHTTQRKTIQSDDLGNIYYLDTVAGCRIVKINTQNPDQITMQTLTSEHESANEFLVDGEGNILFVSYVDNIPIISYRSKDGKYKQLLQFQNGWVLGTNFWLHSDGKMYLSKQNDNFTYIQIYQIGEDMDNLLVPYGELMSDFPVYANETFIYTVDERTVLLGQNTSGQLTMVELNNPEQRPRKVTDLSMTSPKAGNSDQFLYLVASGSSNRVKKCDPGANYAMEDVVLGDELTVKTMSVTSNDEITLYGFRTSDRSNILATVDSNGIYTVLEEALPEVQLVRIK